MIAIGERNFMENFHKGASLKRGFPEEISLMAFLTPQTQPTKMQMRREPTAREMIPNMMCIFVEKSIFVRNGTAPEERAEGIPKIRATDMGFLK